MISATESPAAGVAASEISTMPNSTPSIRATSLSDQFAGACDLENGSFDDLGQFRQIAVGILFDDGLDDAGAGDTDVQRIVRLADAVMGSGHERVVAGDIGENGDLSAADTRFAANGQIFKNMPEPLDRGHVQSGQCRAEVEE